MEDKKVKKKKSLLRRLCKWVGLSIAAVLLLVVVAFCVALWYLTPERLTPLVNRYGSEYLIADVDAARVELTFWSTFPRLNIRVDNLKIVSRSLDGLTPEQRRALPADADSLLNLERMSGGIHLLRLLTGEFQLYDLQLKNPRINLVVAGDSVTNYNIVPTSPPSQQSATIPPISIDRFALQGSMPVRYRAPADSIDFTLNLLATEIKGKDSPVYRLELNGLTGTTIGDFHIPPVPFEINGKLRWDQKTPMALGLTDFALRALDVEVQFNAMLDFSDDLMVSSGDINVPRIEFDKIASKAPEGYRQQLKEIDTDMGVTFAARLLKPYAPAQSELPQLDMSVGIDASRVNYQSMRLSRLDLLVHAIVDGADLDRSVIELQRCRVVGHAMDFNLNATVTSPVSDPNVDASFSGNLNFSRLPQTLLAKLPCTLSGTVHGEADMRFRLSQLSPKRLHRVAVDGELTLNDFRMAMRDGSCDAFLHRGVLKLGSQSRFLATDNKIVDSLFTASVNVDTLAFNAPGLHFAGRTMMLAMGSKNVASSADTTQINPLGGVIKADLLTLNADSADTRIKLQDLKVKGALRRFNDDARAPQMQLSVGASRVRYSDTDMKASLRSASATLDMHPRVRQRSARLDSLAALYPGLSDDSLRSILRRSRTPNQPSGRENIDFGIDNSLKAWLRKWQLHGDIKAERGRVYLSQFPIRNRLSDMDVCVSTDSVVVRSAKIRTGKSDFEISGAIRNINKALTSRRHRPIEIDFKVVSDTIDINDLSAAFLRGAAQSGGVGSIADAGDEEIDRLVDEATASTETAALVVPSNVSARLDVRARHVQYADLWLQRFRGTVSVYDGAVSLDRLKASTDMGAVEFSGLYSAPTRRDINFAAGVNIKKLKLSKFLQSMPQIDSIMPILSEMDGVVDAQLAVTSSLDSLMNFRLSTLDMALRLAGDSLVLMDSETFRTVSKWLMFKNKKRNMVDHMDVEITVHDGWLNLFPVVFDIDRYKLGVVGNNDMDFNLDYHVAVLKSPIPFKFGINIKGTPEKMKIRLGRARLNEKTAASRNLVADSMRVNLLEQMRDAFGRGIKSTGTRGLRVNSGVKSNGASASSALQPAAADDETFTHADSVILIQQGLMERPEGFVMPGEEEKAAGKKSKQKKKK